MKLVINRCFGGFHLSDTAYEWLGRNGIPIQKYHQQKRGANGLYLPQPLNDGEVIFDNELTPEGEDDYNDIYWRYKGKTRTANRYWDSGWTSENRSHPLILRVVEELGSKASGWAANLEIVEIPDDVNYEIDGYDGQESVHEVHRSW